MKRLTGMILTLVIMGSAAVPCFAFGWNKNAAAQPQESAANTVYAFSAAGIEILVGSEADPVVEKLGAPQKTFEQDSCAYQGKDIVYTYPGFELSVFPDGGKNRIADIYIPEGSSVTTPEGIAPGAAKDAFIKAYGNDYTEKWGVYRYKKGDTELIFFTKGDKVEAIEYQFAKQG